VFEPVLTPEAAQRATSVVQTVLAHGLRAAVAGSLARAVQQGRPVDPKYVAAFHEFDGLGDRHAG
jgi:hypothetical protein